MPNSHDEAIKTAMMRLLRRRYPKSICPSEVARLACADDWRGLMPEVRRVAARFAEQGLVRVTRGERDVDAETARGPIRLRLREV